MEYFFFFSLYFQLVLKIIHKFIYRQISSYVDTEFHVYC